MRAILLSCTIVVLITSDAAALADTERSPLQRLRPMDRSSAAIVQAGREQSPVFRALTDAIERSDVIVYIELSAMARNVGGGLVFVSSIPGYRIVRVRISHTIPERTRIPMLAHELQHVLEIAATPSVRSRETFQEYYRRIGVPGARTHSFDSLEARETERRVRHDLDLPAEAADLASAHGDDPPSPPIGGSREF